MTDASRATLLRLLQDSYDELRNTLTRLLGSPELASDALQDTFLRVEAATEIGPIVSPKNYLLRIARNIAVDHRRADARHATVSEVEILMELADEAPGPARIAESRSEIEALKRALMALPHRRREIFLAAWVEGASRREIAARFGISERRIKAELKIAREYCAAHMFQTE